MAHVNGYVATVGLPKSAAHRLGVLAQASDDVGVHGA